MIRPLNIHHWRGIRKLSWTLRLAVLLVASVLELGQVVELHDVLVIVGAELEAWAEPEVALQALERRGGVETVARRRVRGQRLTRCTDSTGRGGVSWPTGRSTGR